MKHLCLPCLTVTGLTCLLFVCSTLASTMKIRATGSVSANAIAGEPMKSVKVGEQVLCELHVDSSSTVSGVYPSTAGFSAYNFSLVFSGGVKVGLSNKSSTPSYFVLSKEMQGGGGISDGFWLSESVNSPGGAPLTQEELFLDLEVSYKASSVPSLDITKAAGTYDYTNLTVFGFNIWRANPDNVAMVLNFTDVHIIELPSAQPAPLFQGNGTCNTTGVADCTYCHDPDVNCCCCWISCETECDVVKPGISQECCECWRKFEKTYGNCDSGSSGRAPFLRKPLGSSPRRLLTKIKAAKAAPSSAP